jgi:Flp pilus assembly protein TadG
MGLKKFLRDEAGGIMPIFAISLVPIIGLVGASVDLAGVTRAHNKLQVAVDTTALALNHNLHLPSVQANIQTKAAGYFATQAEGLEEPHLDPVDFSVADGRVDVSATAKYTPQLLTALGLGPYEISARARTVVGNESIEVALVLDNSGSMAGSKIDDLETAAEGLVNTLFDSVTERVKVKIAVVPFSGAVNVGAANATADWMDKNALSPVHSENFVSPKNRFDLFATMKTSWKGCVEVRPGVHMTTDSEPTATTPSSLFVPMFAPDELDEPNVDDDDKVYWNSYISDNGSCTTAERNATNTTAGKQSRICKYTGAKPSTAVISSTNRGPNFWCNSNPIVPLTDTKLTVTNALDAMVAKGFTNIHEGLMWGWRVLSPGKPFTQGAPYETQNVRKYIVLMTDGVNTIYRKGRTNINRTDYTAYGYATKNRLAANANTMSEDELEDAMDDRLETACENAKNDDPLHPGKITIFTVAFQVNDEDTLQLLQDCATAPANAKTAGSGTELNQAFQEIARDLGQLRLTQ